MPCSADFFNPQNAAERRYTHRSAAKIFPRKRTRKNKQGVNKNFLRLSSNFLRLSFREQKPLKNRPVHTGPKKRPESPPILKKR